MTDITENDFSEHTKLFFERAKAPEPFMLSASMKGPCWPRDDIHNFRGEGITDDTRCACGAYTWAERKRRNLK